MPNFTGAGEREPSFVRQSRSGSEVDASRDVREDRAAEEYITLPIPLSTSSSFSERTYHDDLIAPWTSTHTTTSFTSSSSSTPANPSPPSTPSSTASTIVATSLSRNRRDSTSLSTSTALGRQPQTSIPLHQENLNGFFGLLTTMAPAREDSHDHSGSQQGGNADRYVSWGRGGAGNFRRMSDFTDKSTSHTENTDHTTITRQRRRRSSLWSMTSTENGNSEAGSSSSRRASIVEMAKGLFHGRRESLVTNGQEGHDEAISEE